jgi:hypothetical protein
VGIKILIIGLFIPYFVQTLFSIWAYLGIKRYSDSIKSSKEWEAFSDFSKALLVFSTYILWVPFTTEIYLYARNHNLNYSQHVLQLEDYFITIITLAIAIYLYRSSIKLLKLVKVSDELIRLRTNLIFLVFASLYVFLVYKSNSRLSLQNASLLSYVFPTAFFEPDWLSAITIIIPRLIYWYLIIFAALNFKVFHTNIKGKFYKESFRLIPTGILLVIISYISLRVAQYLLVTHWGIQLAPILILILSFAFSVGVALGFLLIARGASELYKIEKLK